MHSLFQIPSKYNHSDCIISAKEILFLQNEVANGKKNINSEAPSAEVAMFKIVAHKVSMIYFSLNFLRGASNLSPNPTKISH
jgi:3-methyladenine DNA glycosylase AlkC